MKSESGTKEGHAALLKLHRGARLSRTSQAENRTRIVHSHKSSTCRRRASCASTDIVLPTAMRLSNESQPITDTQKDDSETLDYKSNTPRKELHKRTKMPESRKRSIGYGYERESIRGSIPDDADEDIDINDSDTEENEKIRSREASVLHTDRVAYDKMCKLEGITPCGRFQRQMTDIVADVSNSQLGTKDIKSICVMLSSNVTIRELDLSGNDLSGKGAGYVAEAMGENTTVSDITLSECNIDLEGLKAIADVLLDMKPLKRIDLSKNHFGRNHAEVLSEVIKRNDYIEELVLSGNQFDNVGGTVLGKALMSNVGIKKLDLSWNHLRREGATNICMALRYNQTLEELDLSWNGLAEEGCRALGTALPFNHTLKELDITCNRISPFALRHLLMGLEKNDTLKTFRICQNPLTTDGAIALVKSLTKSASSQLTDIHMIDIPINPEFLDALDELLQVRQVKVYHRDPNKKKITPIVRHRTLKDYDPAMILFEYMKQENLRLIDLFRTFDTDSSQSVSKDELKEGFLTINMPLSDESLDSLFDKLDLNDNDEIEYEEYKVGYRKTMRKMRQGLASDNHHEVEAMTTLKGLVHKALDERRQEKLMVLRGKRRQRQASLTAVFKVGQDSDLRKRLEQLGNSKLNLS